MKNKETKIFFCGLVVIIFIGFSMIFAFSAKAYPDYSNNKYDTYYNDAYYSDYDVSYYDYEYNDYSYYVDYYLSYLYNTLVYRFPFLARLFNRFF